MRGESLEHAYPLQVRHKVILYVIYIYGMAAATQGRILEPSKGQKA